MKPTPLSERWWTESGRALAEEALASLMAGRPLDGLGLDEHEGRIDLRGLPAPIPRRLRRFEAQGWFVEQLGDLVRFRGRRLTGLDLGGVQLQSFRFFDSQVSDCIFDRANCQDWRLWGTEVSDCSFVRATCVSSRWQAPSKDAGTFGDGPTSARPTFVRRLPARFSSRIATSRGRGCRG